jgi:RNA polymerase-binding protein DksA
MMANLNQDQINHLMQLMDARNVALRAEIREELLRSSNEHFKDITGGVADVGDESVADAVTDLDAAAMGRQIREIRDIEAAQKRMQDGSFGICIDCGAEIGYERLCAYPTAKRCVTCQGQREKTFSHEGTPSL